MDNKAVSSARDVGRKPSKNPKRHYIGVRVDDATFARLNAERARLLEAERLDLDLADIVRRLITVALDVQAKPKRK